MKGVKLRADLADAVSSSQSLPLLIDRKHQGSFINMKGCGILHRKMKTDRIRRQFLRQKGVDETFKSCIFMISGVEQKNTGSKNCQSQNGTKPLAERKLMAQGDTLG